MPAMKEYVVELSGVPHTFLYTTEDAELRGLTSADLASVHRAKADREAQASAAEADRAQAQEDLRRDALREELRAELLAESAATSSAGAAATAAKAAPAAAVKK